MIFSITSRAFCSYGTHSRVDDQGFLHSYMGRKEDWQGIFHSNLDGKEGTEIKAGNGANKNFPWKTDVFSRVYLRPDTSRDGREATSSLHYAAGFWVGGTHQTKTCSSNDNAGALQQ